MKYILVFSMLRLRLWKVTKNGVVHKAEDAQRAMKRAILRLYQE